MPSPTLCCQCKIFGDDFQRANSDDPGNYTELGGSDYDVDNNELLCVVGGLLICDTVHPGGAGAPQRVKRRFKRSSTSEHARVVLAEQDANNYLYASVETVSGCDVLRLFKVVGGSATELGTAQTIGDGAPTGTWHTLEGCLSIEPGYYYAGGADVFRAKVTLASGKIYGTQAPPEDFVGGDKVGIDDSANVRCDDFYFGWMKDENTACKGHCPECKTGACLIESDDFPGGSETTCKWDSGKLRVFHPELGTKHYATATFDLADGENAEARANMKADASEYHWAKLALSGSTLTLTIGKTGTTLDTKTRSASAGEYTLTVCFDGNLITGVGGSLSAAKLSTTITDGIYAGRAGTADFTYFEFQKHFAVGGDSACPNCQEPTVNCTACCNDLPFYIAVDLDAALTEFSTACDGCTTIGGTYIVSNITPCSWNIIVPLCDSAVGGMGWCWRVNPEITEVHPSLQVGVSLQKNPATGKCYWAGLAGVVATGACYNPAEDTFCDCTLTITCEESTIWPDCVTAPADGGMLAQAHYQSAEFDVGQCPPFPVIMQKVSQITGFPCKGDWPDTMTIQPA